jgi:superfamily II DNA or RNA helicase
MILAHNKSILTYLYDAINHHQIADVGYYVGGMKKEKLKESESKKIIIGTYAMASEGLDIKTLTTLIMATPKSDIVQTVGRILRTNHGQPLVIDIVDKHDMFQRQFLLRNRYYKKQKYTILRSSNSKFENNEWVTLYDPSKKDKKKTAPKNDCLFDFIE